MRDRPTRDFVDEIRARYPVDAPTDALLTKKMMRRWQPRKGIPRLDELVQSSLDLMRFAGARDPRIESARWLSGGASKIQVLLDAAWTPVDGHRVSQAIVVRMDPPESSNTTSRRREFEILQNVAHVVPVPQVHWLDDEARWFPYPALMYDFIGGVTKPTGTTSGRVSGMGTDFGPRLRSLLLPQFVSHLAALHRFDFPVDGKAFARPRAHSTESAMWELNRARRVWDEDRGEESLVMEVAARWLERNLPRTEEISLVHGDFRSGNFLFDERSGQITAWLDWERSYLGDRHRDLAWLLQTSFGHMDQESGEFLACGLATPERILRAYESEAGWTIDSDRLKYYRVMNGFQSLVTSLASAYRVVRLGSTHQDMLLAHVKGAVAMLTHELLTLLDEVV